MRCPFCKGIDTRVIDSRMVEEGASIRRRRKCVLCEARFTTYERYSQTPLMIIKKNNRREPFDPEKIRTGIVKACNKRDIPESKIDDIVKAIEEKVRSIPNSEVKADYLGSLVMNELKELDMIAYLRFASVYKEFDKPVEFIKEVQNLNSTGASIS